MIALIDQLRTSKPAMLTWTNRRGETIGNGPLLDTTETSKDNTSITSAVARAMEEDDDNDVVVDADED